MKPPRVITGRKQPLPPVFMELLEERLPSFGSSVAIEAPGHSVTYRGLWEHAGQIANRLRKLGVSKGDCVGLVMPPSVDFFASVLGVWWLGAAFVPIDPSCPGARRESMLRQAKCGCVLTTPSTAELVANRQVISLRDSAFRARCSPLPRCKVEGDDVAYVIFTSGSTGEPKGVVVAHQGLTNILEEQRKTFGLSEGSRALFYLSVGFDAAISDFGTTFLAGATLVIPEEAEKAPSMLCRTLRDHSITHIDLPPVVATRIDPKELPGSLRCVVLGGEVTPQNTVRALLAPERKVFNVYGPTETTICVSMVECSGSWEVPNLGTPVANTVFEVIPESSKDESDEDGAFCGELWIGGAGVARGFLNNPQLTDERFILRDGIRWYKTGDFVSVRDGVVTYLGRQDRQVKVRGAIANLGEVESLFEECPEVQKAAALKDVDGIVVAIVLRDVASGEHGDLLRQLQDRCREKLASWIIPREVIVCDSLPTNSSGKVDYARVKQLRGDVPSPELPSLVIPLSAEREGIASVIKKVLGVKSLRLEGSFIEQGGDSLSALEVITNLEAEYGFFLSQEQLLFAPSLSALLTSMGERGAPTQALETYCNISASIKRRLAKQASQLPEIAPKKVLVTGAAGSLGGELVQELLKHTKAHVVCLVRGKEDQEAQLRLQARFGDKHVDWSRVTVVRGDLHKPLLGLSRSVWRELARSVDSVWHLAADTSAAQDPGEARRESARGMEEILRLVSWGKAKWLHCASTFSVITSTSRGPGVLRIADTLDESCRVFGGYAQGKWICERILHSVALPHCSVYRLGLLVRDDDREALSLLISLIREEGIVPRIEDNLLAIELISVRGAARAMVRHKGRGIVHIARSKPVTLSRVTKYARRKIKSVAEIDGPGFVSRVKGNPRATPPLMAAIAAIGSGRVTRPELSLFEITGWRVERGSL